MSAPAGHTKLPPGIRCRCLNLWQENDGEFWCCKPVADCDHIFSAYNVIDDSWVCEKCGKTAIQARGDQHERRVL